MEGKMKNQQIKTFMMVKAKDEKGIERVGYIDMIEGTIRDANGREWKRWCCYMGWPA